MANLDNVIENVFDEAQGQVLRKIETTFLVGFFDSAEGTQYLTYVHMYFMTLEVSQKGCVPHSLHDSYACQPYLCLVLSELQSKQQYQNTHAHIEPVGLSMGTPLKIDDDGVKFYSYEV